MPSPNPLGFVRLYWRTRHRDVTSRRLCWHYLALAQQARGKRRPCRVCGMVWEERCL